MDNEALADGDTCGCGGEVDKLYLIQQNPGIWQGRCFQCGKAFTVVSK